MLKYLVECSPSSVSHEDLINEVWGNRLNKSKKSLPDEDTIKVHIGNIREYLEDTRPFRYIITDHKSYKCNFERIDGDSDYLNSQINDLNQKINDRIIEMERIQSRMDTAVDERWKEIYATQFDSTYIMFLKAKHDLDEFKRLNSLGQAQNNIPKCSTKHTGCINQQDSNFEELFHNVAHHKQKIQQLDKKIENLFHEYPPDEIFPKT